jgi:hypothetical protein
MPAVSGKVLDQGAARHGWVLQFPRHAVTKVGYAYSRPSGKPYAITGAATDGFSEDDLRIAGIARMARLELIH